MNPAITLTVDFEKLTTEAFMQGFRTLLLQIVSVYPRPVTVVIFHGLTSNCLLAAEFSYAIINNRPLPFEYEIAMPYDIDHPKTYRTLPENVVQTICFL